MKLENPDASKPFDEIKLDKNGNPEYGIRGEEIVHIPSGRSNVSYYQPEVVMDASGCDHEFQLYDVAKREIECLKCRFATTFILGVNFEETPEGSFVTLKNKKYPVNL